ncbi:hypothetical protein EDB87DRAFT_1607868 [Lactarius vividus]|nr:hypothetical protein EDB87DRAFT_1607868 [Lactarius vividus]
MLLLATSSLPLERPLFQFSKYSSRSWSFARLCCQCLRYDKRSRFADVYMYRSLDSLLTGILDNTSRCLAKRDDIVVADRGIDFAIRKGLQLSRSTVRWLRSPGSLSCKECGRAAGVIKAAVAMVFMKRK